MAASASVQLFSSLNVESTTMDLRLITVKSFYVRKGPIGVCGYLSGPFELGRDSHSAPAFTEPTNHDGIQSKFCIYNNKPKYYGQNQSYHCFPTTYIIFIKMAANNKINKDCVIHKKNCDLFCTSSKCVNKILCEKCIPDHLEVHPRQFIYSLENLSEIHSFDKVSKMKEVLGKHKVINEQRITKIYSGYDSILDPLIQRVKQFHRQSKDLIVKQLLNYLTKNKTIIENTKIKKSDTNTIKNVPQTMVEQTIAEVEVINQRQSQMKLNTQNFTWYADATQELCISAQDQLTSMVKVAIKLLDNFTKIQLSRYTETEIGRQSHHDQSFFRRYVNSHEVASKGDKNAAQMALIQSKKQMLRKDQEIKRTKNQIKEKVTKIQELNLKIEGLKEELLQWEQKLQRQQKERREAAGRERKKLEQFLIKNDIISNDVNVISMQKKVLQDKYLNLVSQLVPNPIQLNLSQHNLTRPQLESFARFTSLQVFRMSFINCDKEFLSIALKRYENLHTLQLNSANITDQILEKISAYFPSKLKHLFLIDNKINDDGLQYMFKNLNTGTTLQSLYVSYNNLSSRAVEVINRYCYQIKILHISKNPIKSKGAASIGKFLKDIEELFIGGTGVQKEGFLAICRNCIKLKRLSLVANEVTTDIVSELLLGLQRLQWLDISYTGLNQSDMEKVEKLKIFNKGVEIVAHI